MGSYGPQKIERIGSGDTRRVSIAPEGIRRWPVDWNSVSGEAGDRCIPLGTIMIPIKSEGKRTGLVGPYDANATDGRQFVERSNAFILNETVCEKDQGSEPVEMFESGRAYKPLLQVGSEGQPTWEEFDLAFSQLRFLSD
jgi:hypothetical protein